MKLVCLKNVISILKIKKNLMSVINALLFTPIKLQIMSIQIIVQLHF